MGANSSAAKKNAQVAAATALQPYSALYSTVPTTSAGTELSGGSPAYARKANAWTGTNPQTSVTVHDVPAGGTVAGAGHHSASTGGSYIDGGAVTSQAFASQGTYTLTATEAAA